MRSVLLFIFLLTTVVLSAVFLTPTRSHALNEASEYVVEFRLTQQGKKIHVEAWTQPNLGQDGVIYFEIAEGTRLLERLQLHRKQAHIQESEPTPILSTPYSYYARYKRGNHQRLDRVMLKVSNLIFPIKLEGELPDGVYTLIIAVSVDQDNDGALAQTRVLNDSRWLQFCSDYDNNPLAHPLQTKFFYEPRGDGSWDWNCNGKVNLSQVSFGKPGVYELLGTKCVEVIPPERGWVSVIPTEAGVLAHCYTSFTDNKSVDFAVVPNDLLPVCGPLTALCVQGGN